MNRLLQKAASTMAFLVGFFLLGSLTAAAALADDGSAIQVDVKVKVDRRVERAITKVTKTVASVSRDATAGGDQAIASGNQAAVGTGSPSVDAGVCGNAVALGGQASASCEGNQSSDHRGTKANSNGARGDRNRPLLSQNQLAALTGFASVKAMVCGVSIAVFGNASGNCGGNQSTVSETGTSNEGTTGSNYGVASGNQVAAGTGSPSAQAGVCGIAVSVAGDASGSCEGTQSSNSEGSVSNGDNGGGGADALSDNQVAALTGSPSAQAQACGVSISVYGDASSSCEGNQSSNNGGSVSTAPNGGEGSGILSDNQVATLTGSPSAQAQACGVSVSVYGDSSTSCEGTQTSANEASTPSNGHGGAAGTGSGNEADVLTGSPSAQVGACGIAISVAGNSSTECAGSQAVNGPGSGVENGGGAGTGGDPGSGGGAGTGGGNNNPGVGGGAGTGEDGAAPGIGIVGSGGGTAVLEVGNAAATALNGRQPIGGVQAGAGGTAFGQVAGSWGLTLALMVLALSSAAVITRVASRSG